MTGFIFVGVIACLIIIGDYVLRRKLKVLKHEKMEPRPKRFENMIVAIMIISYLIMSATFIFKNEDMDPLLFVLPFFIIISLFRALMEWRFNRLARKWAMEIYSLVVLSVFIVVLLIAGDKIFA